MKRWYENKLDARIPIAIGAIIALSLVVWVGGLVINAQWETLDAYIAAHPNATIYIYN